VIEATLRLEWAFSTPAAPPKNDLLLNTWLSGSNH
jgi:hypothetical protein